MFKNTTTGIACLALALLAPLAIAVADESGETVKLQGEVLDLACYIGHESHGEEHAKCAVNCVKSGQPMGLLADDGTVYLLFASHRDATAYEQAKTHAGKQVEIEGKLADRAGIKGVEVAAVKAK